MALEYDVSLRDDTTPVLLEGVPADPESCYLIEEIQGLDGRDIREEVLELPDRDGDYLGGVRAAGLTLILTGKIVGVDRADLRTRERALRAALAPTDTTWQLRLTGRVGDPEDLIASVRTSGGGPFRSSDKNTDSRRVKAWQAAVRAADAVLYGVTEQSVTVDPVIGEGGLDFPIAFPITFGAGAGGGEVVVNGGEAKTWPMLRLFGPITQPIIGNLTTGEYIVSTGSIDSGDFWEIDLARQSVRENGPDGPSVYHLIDRASSSFWGLDPGASTIHLQSSAFSGVARLEVTWHNAYL